MLCVTVDMEDDSYFAPNSPGFFLYKSYLFIANVMHYIVLNFFQEYNILLFFLSLNVSLFVVSS